MSPPTSFSQKRKRPAYDSEDETTHILGSIDNNTGTSQWLDGHGPWSQADGSKRHKSGGGSTGGVWPAGVVSAPPRGRFDRPGTDAADHLASPSMSAGTPRREQIVGSTTLLAGDGDQRGGPYRGFHSNSQTRDERPHPRSPWDPCRAVRSATPSMAPPTTPDLATVRSNLHGRESQERPQIATSVTMRPPHARGATFPGGLLLRHTPIPDPANALPHCGPSYGGTSSSTVMSSGTSHYAGAHGFNIQHQHITTNNLGSSRSLYDYLKEHVSPGAAYDSRDRRDAPVCHEETRVAIRENVVGWFKEDKGEGETGTIMWLGGPAGGGKSAIAGSVAKACDKEGILAATFFFSSFSPSMDRRCSRGLIATLAHQMSQHKALGQFSSHLFAALQRCPDIFDKTLKVQAERLILEPFQGVQREVKGVGWPRAVIVDGIDEVVAQHKAGTKEEQLRELSEKDQVEVLEVLLTLSRSPHFPFRILVASRPEQNITDFFDKPAIHRFTVPLFLDSKYNPDADIERFLWSKFAQIRRRFRLPGASWPEQEAVDRIVEMSSGQFIVPTTVVRWIESGMPKQQLDEVLKLQRSMGSKNPLASLDTLYRYILMRARNPDCDANLVIKWMNAINFSMDQHPALLGPETPAAFWRSFLQDKEGELDFRLAPISSLISIPPPDDLTFPITFYHKSFIDYLSNQTRCEDLYVSKEEANLFVSRRIVVVLKHIGPRVPLLPPQRLDDFLSRFQLLHLVRHYVARGGTFPIERVETFLNHLGVEELDALASCDLAWWARIVLVPQQDRSATLPRLLHGIHFGIHKVSKCIDLPRRGDLSARQAAQEEGKPGCHPACIHWRTGVLAEVKKRGWCTHRLDVIPLHKLQDVTFNQADDILGVDAHKACRVCATIRPYSWYDRTNPEKDKVLGISYDEQLGQYVQL